MAIYHLSSAQDNATGDYRQVGYMKIEDEAGRFLQFWFWMVLTAVAALAFFLLSRNIGKLPVGFHIGTRELIVGALAIVATLFIHEWLHGLILRRIGAHPKYDLFRNFSLGTIMVPGFGLRRNTAILVVLAPLVVLTGLALLGIWLTRATPWVALFALVAVVNVLAAMGDFWLVGILLRYPRRAWTVNDHEGMLILMPKE